jgi:dimethylhistidine N-methyltransferase
MRTELVEPRLRFSDLKPPPADFRREVVEGLRRPHKALSPKFFYDPEGCRLFEAICDLPEYYLTRTEVGILTEHADSIARTLGQGGALIELGSGNSRKVRLLLEALKPAVYIPVDIAREHLLTASRALAADCPWLDIHAACLDYSQRFALPFLPDTQRKIVFFPGSSIGNFEPAAAENLLRSVAQCVQPDGGLLIGFDLKKDAAILNAAYNDSAGVTAQFNLNLLRCINARALIDFTTRLSTMNGKDASKCICAANTVSRSSCPARRLIFWMVKQSIPRVPINTGSRNSRRWPITPDSNRAAAGAIGTACFACTTLPLAPLK